MILKQVARRALVAVLTFSTGLALSPEPSPKQIEFRNEPQALSVCAMLQNPTLLTQGDVRLRGMLYGNPDGTLVLNELDCAGDGAWMTVSLDDSLTVKGETRRFVERVRRQSMGETMARAEVLIVGRLKVESRRREGAPRYTVSVRELEPLTQISIVSFVSN